MGWTWKDEPDRYKPTKCKCCRKCWFDILTQRCVYGGPYDGYIYEDGHVEVLEDEDENEKQ